jgi:hypothetical protein|tara:strand:- start:1194 stop:1400 length:207 start_codon:yes stop_codon:yes gene_type:complete
MLSSSGSKVLPSPTNPFVCLLLFLGMVLIDFFSELLHFSALLAFFYFGLAFNGRSRLKEPMNKLCYSC